MAYNSVRETARELSIFRKSLRLVLVNTLSMLFWSNSDSSFMVWVITADEIWSLSESWTRRRKQTTVEEKTSQSCSKVNLLLFFYIRSGGRDGQQGVS